MPTSEPHLSEREAFQRLLEVCGSDRARWPAVERLRFAQLLARDAVARSMLAEAAALDRLLDSAPSIPQRRHAMLAARIVADGARLRSADAPVEPLRFESNMKPARRRFRQFPAVGLLAASLAAGLVIGFSGAANPILDNLAAFVGDTGDSDLELVLADDLGTSDEESL